MPLFPVVLVIAAVVAGLLIYEKTKQPKVVEAPPRTTHSVPGAAPTPPATEEPKPVASETGGKPAPKTADIPSTTPAPVSAATPAPASVSATAKWLAEQVPQWEAAYASEVSGPFEKGVAGLKQQYLAALEKQLAALAQAAKLDDAVVFRAERDRMSGGGEVPAEDEAAIPAALKALRASYRIAYAKLDTERFGKAKIFHARYDAILQQSQTALTQRQRLDEALEMKAQREALSAAWLPPVAGAAPIAPAIAPSATPKPDGSDQSGRAPLASTAPGGPFKEAFTNTLGMKLVPVPGTGVLFCIHETRRKDYAAYAAEVSGVEGLAENTSRTSGTINPWPA